MAEVSVVIPNLNGADLLPMCLETLKRQTFKDFNIIVVDNGSRDRSVELLRENYPEVSVVPLDKNYGFAFAVNRGIEVSSGEFVCLLNNDMELDPGWMSALRAALIEHPEAGSCGPKILRYWERDRFNVLGIRMNSNGSVDIIGAGQYDKGQYEEVRYVFGVNAGAAMYRKRMFDDIGLFDEEFFASFEDVDHSFRAQMAGYKALYVPQAIVYHMVGATIKRRRYQPTYLNNRNSILFFWKDMPSDIIKKNLAGIVGNRTGQFVKRVFLNFYKLRTYYFLKGVIAAYIRLPYITRARKQVQSSRKVSIEYIASIMDRDFI